MTPSGRLLTALSVLVSCTPALVPAPPGASTVAPVAASVVVIPPAVQPVGSASVAPPRPRPPLQVRSVIVWHPSGLKPLPAPKDSNAPALMVINRYVSDWYDEEGGRVTKVASRPGVILAAQESLMEWSLRDEKKKIRCNPSSFVGIPPCTCEAREFQVGTITQLETNQHKEYKDNLKFDPDLSSEGYSIDLMASLGPYLFLYEVGYAYGCGAAHGNTGASFTLLDANTMQPVELLTKDELARVNSELMDQAFQQTQAATEHFDDSKPQWTLALPRVNKDGAPELLHQFTASSCYACSDGLWSSYSQSVRLPTTWMPARLQPYALPSEAARVIAATLGPEDSMGYGVLTLDESHRKALLAEFQGQSAPAPATSR